MGNQRSSKNAFNITSDATFEILSKSPNKKFQTLKPLAKMAEEALNDDWSSDANEALNISLVTPASAGGAKPLFSFNPKMTYAIFGEKESIFGYKKLKINLKFNASDMRPSLQILYSKKFKPVGETEPADLNGLLEEYLPKSEF